jgi:hypothetical protein
MSFAEPQPLAGRKTDEGFAIYKEDELGIDVEAGGQLTPLFVSLFTSPQEHHYVPSIVLAVSVVPLLPLTISNPM